MAAPEHRPGLVQRFHFERLLEGRHVPLAPIADEAEFVPEGGVIRIEPALGDDVQGVYYTGRVAREQGLDDAKDQGLIDGLLRPLGMVPRGPRVVEAARARWVAVDGLRAVHCYAAKQMPQHRLRSVHRSPGCSVPRRATGHPGSEPGAGLACQYARFGRRQASL